MVMHEDGPAGQGAGAHLLDATMFWSEAGGGVRRYALAKRAAWVADGAGRHTLLAPGVVGPGMVDCGGLAIPKSGGYRLPWRRAQAARLIEAQRPDIVEAGDPFVLAWAARDAAARLQVPAVLFVHSHLGEAMAQWLPPRLPRTAEAVSRFAGRYLAHVCDGFDLVLAPSRAMQRALTRLGIAGVAHQPLGVDTSVFRPGARDAGWRAELGLPDDARVLLYVGRFAPEKHLPLLAAVVQRLGPQYRLVALGAGPRPPAGPQVIVRPYEPRPEGVARALAGADVVVHAGDQETFGLAVLEAMACGTPVVARASAGLAELVTPDCGFPVASALPDDWGAAIAAAFTPARVSRRAAALERARAHDWRIVLAALRRRYDHVIDAVRGGPAAELGTADTGHWRMP